jgi:hypothetical protein
MDANISKIHY